MVRYFNFMYTLYDLFNSRRSPDLKDEDTKSKYNFMEK